MKCDENVAVKNVSLKTQYTSRSRLNNETFSNPQPTLLLADIANTSLITLIQVLHARYSDIWVCDV